MPQVAGSFAGTGTSAAIAGTKITIKMDFAGTASVDVEEQMPSGAWIKVVTGTTADYRSVYESPTITTIRLNCTAFTNAVEYVMETN